MGRPIKDTADYFPHMTTHKKTMFIIEGKWGNDGYALWFKLLECLGHSPGHYYDCRQKDSWEYLYTYARISEELATEILDKLADMGAIDQELWGIRVIWSDNFVEGLKPLYQRRKQVPPDKPSFFLHKPEQAAVIARFTCDKSDSNTSIPPIIPTENDKVSKVSIDSRVTTTTTNTTNSPDEESFVVVVDHLTKNICMVSNQVEADLISEWTKALPRDWITEAINQAALAKARSIKYIDTILRSWKEKYRLDEKPWEVEASGRNGKDGLPRGHRRDPTEADYARDRSSPGWGT